MQSTTKAMRNHEKANKSVSSLKKSNDELTDQLEQRLENIRKLMSKNEQLTNQQQVLKKRHEKTRKEEAQKFQA